MSLFSTVSPANKKQRNDNQESEKNGCRDQQLSARTCQSHNCYFLFITLTFSHSSKNTYSGKSINTQAGDMLCDRRYLSSLLSQSCNSICWKYCNKKNQRIFSLDSSRVVPHALLLTDAWAWFILEEDLLMSSCRPSLMDLNRQGDHICWAWGCSPRSRHIWLCSSFSCGVLHVVQCPLSLIYTHHPMILFCSFNLKENKSFSS